MSRPSIVANRLTAGSAAGTFTSAACNQTLQNHKHLLQETDEVGGDVTKMYASSTTDEFGDLIGEDGEYTHVYDAQANTNALLDTSGQVDASYKYDAFGQVAAVAVEGDAWASLTVDQWGNLTVDQWAGLPVELTSNMLAGGKKQYYLDPETELYLLGTGTNGRYCDAGIGRFISEDPIRQAGEDPNLFGYVRNDPINKLDPSGHTSDDDANKQQEERARQQQADAANARKQAEQPLRHDGYKVISQPSDSKHDRQPGECEGECEGGQEYFLLVGCRPGSLFSMARRLRVAAGGVVYHVLNRAVGRGRIFGKEGDYKAFEKECEENAKGVRSTSCL